MDSTPEKSKEDSILFKNAFNMNRSHTSVKLLLTGFVMILEFLTLIHYLEKYRYSIPSGKIDTAFCRGIESGHGFHFYCIKV